MVLVVAIFAGANSGGTSGDVVQSVDDNDNDDRERCETRKCFAFVCWKAKKRGERKRRSLSIYAK